MFAFAERGRAAGQGTAVLIGVIGAVRVQPTDPFLIIAAGAPVAVAGRGALQFVIADQGDLRTAQGETAHAVELAGHQQAVVHRLAALGDDLVFEPLRQVEQGAPVAF